MYCITHSKTGRSSRIFSPSSYREHWSQRVAFIPRLNSQTNTLKNVNSLSRESILGNVRGLGEEQKSAGKNFGPAEFNVF